MMNNLPITFNIPINISGIDVIFWMRQFTIDTMMKNYKMNYPNPILYLQKQTTYHQRQSMDPDSAKALSFAISNYNLYEVQEIFREASNWFTPENIEILYGSTDSGVLVFNNDYSKLNVLYTNDFGNIKTAIKIVPTTVEVAQGVYKPGVVFYINKQENGIIIKGTEFLRLCNFIEKFNFETYVQFTLSCFNHCAATNSIISQEEVQKRLNAMRTYNTNFNY